MVFGDITYKFRRDGRVEEYTTGRYSGEWTLTEVGDGAIGPWILIVRGPYVSRRTIARQQLVAARRCLAASGLPLKI